MENNKIQSQKEAYAQLKEAMADAEKILVGIGGEWKLSEDADPQRISEVKEGYHQLYELIKDKDYFVVTTVTDGEIWKSELSEERIVAPCGNRHLRQCEKACVKEVWKEDEVSEGVCPHCGAPLVENTIQAENYVEEGYLPMWKKYQLWLSVTLNRKLVVLELGEGFKTPTVIRWPFEKTVFFNQKSRMFRVHESLCQVSQEIGGRATPVAANSLEFICGGSAMME